MSDIGLCSCGSCLGEKIPLHMFLLRKIKEAYYETTFGKKLDNDRVQWDPKWNLNIKVLLNELDFNLPCCRMDIIGIPVKKL